MSEMAHHAPVMTAFGIWLFKCVLAGGCAVASACLVKRTCRLAAPGRSRLLRVAPVIALFCAMPLVFNKRDELTSRASCAAMLLWLANFKLLLFALGRGPLVDPTLRLDQFVALALWPLLRKQGPDVGAMRCGEASAGKRRAAAFQRLTHRLPENLLITVVGAKTLVSPHVPLFLKTYSAAFSVSCYCDMCANAAAALVMWLHGLDIAPSWDRPWLQNCLSDFWSRRWNLTAAYTLRALVYEPLVEGRVVRKAADDGADPPTAAAPAGPNENGPTDKQVREAMAALRDQAEAAALRLESHEDPASEHRHRRAVAPVEISEIGHSEGAAGHDTTKALGAPVTGSTKDEKGRAPATYGSAAGRKRRVSPGRRIVALAAAFAISGLMHEVLLLLCTGWTCYRKVAGVQMLYFLLQVPASTIEQVLAQMLKKMKLTIPDYLAIPVTSLSLQVPGLFLFWNPIFKAATCAMQNTA